MVAVVVTPWGVEESSADALVRDAAAATRAALADTGRATTTVVNVMDGERNEPQVVLWEFAGEDERFRPQGIRVDYDNRIVDGENYILGFDSRHPDQWYRVLCNDGARLTPDPRSLASVLRPEADFEVVGEELVDGEWTTHMRARNPAGIPTDAIDGFDNLLDGLEIAGWDKVVTAFDIWVDGDDVARRIDADVEAETIDDRTGEERSAQGEWTIEFSDLGEDVVITAPTEFEDVTCEEGP